jgi:hypothetical protein
MGFSILCSQISGLALMSKLVTELISKPLLVICSSKINLEIIQTQHTIAQMNSSWPVSTPKLNASKATGISVCGRPIPPIEAAIALSIVFQHRFGKHLFEMTILFFEIGYFSAIGLTFGIACQALLTGL